MHPHGPGGQPHTHASAPGLLLQREAQREVQHALAELPQIEEWFTNIGEQLPSGRHVHVQRVAVVGAGV